MAKQIHDKIDGANWNTYPTVVNQIAQLTDEEAVQLMIVYQKSYGETLFEAIYYEWDPWGEYTPALNKMKRIITAYQNFQQQN